MAKVIFSKYPKDTKIAVGKTLTLKADALTSTGAKVSWEFLKEGSGWKKIPKATGKTLTVKKAKATHSGAYRCVIAGVSSRIACVVVGKAIEKDLEPTIEPSKENDAFIEILECTGKDASAEVIEKAATAVSKKLPEALKE